jgi:hypothetical protein
MDKESHLKLVWDRGDEPPAERKLDLCPLALMALAPAFMMGLAMSQAKRYGGRG